MKRGRPRKVGSEEVIEAISEYKSRVFVDGKVVAPTNDVFTEISRKISGRMTPKAVYLFIKNNHSAKLKHEEWGVTDKEGISGGSEKIASDQLSSEPSSTKDSISESSNGHEIHERSFDITLSSQEWSDMAPRELYYKRMKYHDKKKYKGLAPNVWTHIVNEHFWLIMKTSCCLVFKRALVSETDRFYVKMEGVCKGCNGSFVGYINNAPAEGQRVVIRCKYSSKQTCTVAPGKRMLKGIAKEKAKTALKTDTAGGYRAKIAHNLLSFGDTEPSHLPSSNALRCVAGPETQKRN